MGVCIAAFIIAGQFRTPFNKLKYRKTMERLRQIISNRIKTLQGNLSSGKLQGDEQNRICELEWVLNQIPSDPEADVIVVNNTKIDLPVGTRFQVAGKFGTYEVISVTQFQPDPCSECAFRHDYLCGSSICSPEKRSDGLFIIYKRTD